MPDEVSPEGTPEFNRFRGEICRPFGTCRATLGNPALKRWAILKSPSGTSTSAKFRKALGQGGTIFRVALNAATLAAMLCAVSPSANAAEEWFRYYNGTGNGNDQAVAIAADTNGNVFVTGYSFGGGSGSDFATVKYSAAGAPLWTNRYNGPGNSEDGPAAIAVDPSGNVVVAGSSIGTNGFYDYATIKYSNGGVPLWTNRFNGLGNSDDTVAALVIDNAGTVFVSGASASASIPPFNYPSNFDYATVAYSSSGVGLWTNRYNGPANGDDYATAIAVDAGSNVLVAGYSTGSGSGYDYATVKYSGAGVALWTNRYNGPANGNDQPNALAVDTNGNVFVTGRITAGSSYDYATIKYSGAGVALWTNLYNGPGNGTDEAKALATDRQGNVFVTGYSVGTGSSWDFATIKYSSSGASLWTNRYNGPLNASDVATAIVVDGAGCVWVTGFSEGIGSLYDTATVSYSNGGVPLATNRFNGPGNNSDQANALALGSGGVVYVAGFSTTAAGDNDFTILKYPRAIGPLLSMQRAGGALVLSWPNPAFSLQSASSFSGTYSNILGATSPYTNLAPPTQRFFRLISN